MKLDAKDVTFTFASFFHKPNVTQPFVIMVSNLLHSNTGTIRMFRQNFAIAVVSKSRSQWPRGRRRRSAAARLLRSWVRIPPGAWIFVCCECRVLSGRGLCDSSRGVLPTVVRRRV